jgi:uncharacterized protein (DUF952 family)
MEPIFHLAPAARWHSWPPEAEYLPAEYEQDGFVHCTAGAELMLRVANRFYHDVPGEFVVLLLDPEQLHSPLRWEQSTDDLAPLFPHIYGPINRAAVAHVFAVRRAPDGEFLGWEENQVPPQ